MRRAQQRGFIRLGYGHLGDHTPTEQDYRTIASQRDLRKLRGEQQHCGSFSCYFPDQRVDLALGTDIDAASGIKTKQNVEAAGEPEGDYHFLLVAAAQPAQFRPCAGVDLKASDRGFYALSLRA